MLNCHFQLQLGKFKLTQAFESDDRVVGLFGASGSGKTSILHAIAGLNTPQSGWIRIQNQTWFDHSQKINLTTQQRRIGLVFQDAQLFPHMSVKKNLHFGFNRITPEKRHFKEDYIIELLKLGHLLNRVPVKLSGGEKQRVALGRALLYSPQLLLLDEPLSALDAAHKAEIIPFFQKIKQEIHIPMLYVSHDIEEIQQLTDSIWYL
ncbi:molybdenum ABC transporter ATP-binding protein [Acinetobacter sp. S40]|uniref:molybdenum ABC transporter ATP-binding protein n=1 Tax=unclassified Acinetobacter TaxID=196816 RepID=UPI00190E2445|nr:MULTISPECIES: molybdenum ABC transporter ATP-binding protein [unclassified Acinetobacter]MBJ9985362.1 molybdenum ABC transporter ATP-binding protein [Acinetobacter sp. S40]MBK0063703.1 molybdenum ABC transporter ATP-binding protein [Acinetobacter sp. S55]MBK0067008.1 molybdenum ABC transporter ATP-binding protein [Acinetobacter sp. S54]